jgi:hypothetical protein
MTSTRFVRALLAVATLAVAGACNDPAPSQYVPGSVTIELRQPGPPEIASVRIVLKRTTGETAADSSVSFPATQASKTVELNVQMLRGFFSTGEPMNLTLTYLNAAGQTVVTATGAVTIRAK